jgi:sulfide:quinone oxidoreductase
LKKILVLGGGIGGVEAAISLAKEFKKQPQYQIDLISDRKNLFIYPLSIWIPVGKRTPEEISMPLAEIASRRGFNFLEERVERIVTSENRVITDKGAHSYDYLIVAIGGAKLKPAGVENTLSICGGAEEAVKIRDKFSELVDKGSGTIACGFSGNPKDPTAVRGGPVFEVLFNLDHHLREKGLRQNFKLVFFSPSQEAGNRLGEPGLKAVQNLFSERQIEALMGKKITQFDPDGILFEDGTQLKTDLTIFTPGIQGNPVLKNSGLPLTEAGFVPINDFCQVATSGEQNLGNCYAIGDNTAFEGPEWRAKQGHLAEMMARNAAKNIALREKGQPQTATFSQHLNIMCVMDLGKEAAFIYRNRKRAIAPVGKWAHWSKLAWERYYKLNKKGRLPNSPI